MKLIIFCWSIPAKDDVIFLDTIFGVGWGEEEYFLSKFRAECSSTDCRKNCNLANREVAIPGKWSVGGQIKPSRKPPHRKELSRSVSRGKTLWLMMVKMLVGKGGLVNYSRNTRGNMYWLMRNETKLE